VKGERLYDWARFRLFRLQQAPWDHWLLVRRKLSKPDEMAYYVVFGPAATSLEALARIGAGRSRSASRRPSRRSGWTATRCAAGTAGTGTSPCRCWRSPFWRRCGSNSPPKGGRKIRRIHCLQHARDPPPHRPLPAELCIDFILAWSLWRRVHQAVAKACHWKRQAAKLLIYQQTQL